MNAKLLSRNMRALHGWRRAARDYRLSQSRRIARMWYGFGFHLEMEP